jgi:hypothetical protein
MVTRPAVCVEQSHVFCRAGGQARTHAPFLSAECWLGVIPGIEDRRVSAITFAGLKT